MSKHTPDERWKIVEEHQYDQMPGAAQLIETAGGDAVAVMIDTDDPMVCDARAKMAAAAPELAERLAALLARFDRPYFSELHTAEDRAEVAACEAALRAAGMEG